MRPLAPRPPLSLALGTLALAVGCLAPSSEEIAREVRRGMALEPELVLLGAQHRGPRVAAGDSGTARFAPAVYAAFDAERAMDVVRFLDDYYRAPANDGYEAAIEQVEQRLRAAGYGSQPGFELGVIETPLTGAGPQAQQRLPARAWTPLSARLALRRAGESETVLHEFDAPADVDRVMLPIHAPSARVEGQIALSLEDLEAGEILASEAPPSLGLLMRAEAAGAAAVLSANLEPYNVDPSGEQRHLDALQFCAVPVGTSIPVAMISPRSLEAIRAARVADSGAMITLQAEVRFDERPLRTLYARVVGADRPEEAVVISSHVQEPGACDNASGVAGLCEGAVGLAELIQRGALERPSRSLVFLWGDEFRQTESWLDQTELRPVAGLSSDMTGEAAATGAIALLERMPDPGAVQTLPPDEHTLWGKTEVDPAALAPNGLAVIARSALVDVAGEAGGWVTADHPYEGGSDHDVFIERGIPAALFWHFTDFTYHTSMDRLEFVDPAELRRTGAALMTTALALADPRPGDLERYLDSLNQELDLRVAAAEAAGDRAQAKLWKEWCHGARQWLRSECLRIPPGELAPEERR